MSRIEFYKNVRSGIEDDLDTGDASVISYVKDYVNRLDILPSVEIAIEYILENYKKPVNTAPPQVKNTTKPKEDMKDFFKRFGVDDKSNDLPECKNQ